MKSIKEFLINALEDSFICEMAKDQKRCEEHIETLCGPIYVHLVLILYFLTYDDVHTTNLNHWKEELANFICDANNFTIKGNDSFDRRKKLIERAFKTVDADSISGIHNMVDKKIYIEKETGCDRFKDFEERLDEVVLAASKFYDDLIYYIALKEKTFKQTNDIIRNWVYNNFKNDFKCLKRC